MVEAKHRRSAMEVEPLQLRLDLLHLVEELERVAKRIAHLQHAADAGLRRVDPCGREPPRGQISFDQVEIALMPHTEPEPGRGRDRGTSQHQRVPQTLLPAPQIDRVGRPCGHDHSEQPGVEPLRRVEVGHAQLDVRGADDVVRSARRRADTSSVAMVIVRGCIDC